MHDTNNLQLYGIKYSYWIQIIFKQIYLIDRWDSKSQFLANVINRFWFFCFLWVKTILFLELKASWSMQSLNQDLCLMKA